jgi:hypothetical protein
MEPTLDDVMTRLGVLDQTILVLGLEQRAGHAELRLELAGLRQGIHDLEHAMRDLWTEHLGHSHPGEQS